MRLRLNRIIIFILVTSIILASFTVYLDYRLRAVVRAFAKSAVKTVVTNCANRASYKVLNELEIDYSSLAKISRNEAGLATTVEIDSATANKVKSYISNEISTMLAAYEEVTFSVPLFAAFGIYYTTLKWPKLDYTVHITTTVVSDFKSNFKSAGINQVLHQILLEVGLESDIAVLGGNTEQFTITSFIVAETVIVGAVPDAFTSVGHATDEMMEDIFDFGASK